MRARAIRSSEPEAPPAITDTGHVGEEEGDRPSDRPDIRDGKEGTCRGFPVLGSRIVFLLPVVCWSQKIPLLQVASVPSLMVDVSF